jgi:hypothetical protein
LKSLIIQLPKTTFLDLDEKSFGFILAHLSLGAVEVLSWGSSRVAGIAAEGKTHVPIGQGMLK